MGFPYKLLTTPVKVLFIGKHFNYKSIFITENMKTSILTYSVNYGGILLVGTILVLK